MAKIQDVCKKRSVRLSRMGCVDFTEASQLQDELQRLRQANKTSDVILFLEHPPVITIGIAGGEQNVIIPRDILAQEGIPISHTDRGGSVTYHGPGQLIVYPIIDLNSAGLNIHTFMLNLEEAIIRVLNDFSIAGHRNPQYPGVWVEQQKIGAIGVRVRHWITKHGVALNVNNDLKPFSYIHACGIEDKGVTSMRQLLGHEVDREDVIRSMIDHFSQVFDMSIIEQ